MFLEATFIISLLLMIAFLAILSCYLLILYIRTTTKTKETKDMLSKRSGEEALRIIEDAHEKARAIVEQMEFGELRSKKAFAENLDELKGRQLEAFSEVTAQMFDLYQEALAKMEHEQGTMLTDSIKTMQSQMAAEIESFRQLIQKETAAAQKIIEAKIEGEYELLEKDLEAYKKEKLVALDNAVYETLTLVSKAVLGKAISTGEHQELIRSALVEAKKRGIFG